MSADELSYFSTIISLLPRNSQLEINFELLKKVGETHNDPTAENYIFYLLVGQKIIFMIYEAPPPHFEKIGMFSLYYRFIGICK